MDEARQTFVKVREDAEHNADVLGFVVTGSRGKGFENEWSDYDFAIFVDDAALSKYEDAYGQFPGGHLAIFTLESFKDYAAWGSEMAWDRYAWAHLKVEFDRTDGELQRLLDEKGRVPTEHAEQYIHNSLDWFINQVYRSIKCHRAGDAVGHRLEASELVRPFLQAVFCLHDRRLVPYYKYLEWELERYPLEKLRLSSEELVGDLLTILDSADYRVQQKLLREAERVFRAEGYGDTFDAWPYGLPFCLGYPDVTEY